MASYTLSSKDTERLQELQASCLLPSIAVPGKGELVSMFKFMKSNEMRVQMQPFADLLEFELLKMLATMKDRILDDLAKGPSSRMTATLFSWKTVEYIETFGEMKLRESMMSEEKLALHRLFKAMQAEMLKANGYETGFGTKVSYPHYNQEEYWLHYKKNVEAIFRYSDLALRLSLALGPNFYPFISSEYVEGGDPSLGGYRVKKQTLSVQYYPFGVKKNQMLRLLQVDAEQKARLRTTYQVNEVGYGHESLRLPVDKEKEEDEYTHMPPSPW